jgi:glutamate synthase (NADPH/NADH) small chain
MSDPTATLPSNKPARKPKKPKIPRTDMPCQPAEQRATNFEEVTTGYDEATATIEASRCLMCKKPKCVDGCPVGIDIPAFLKLIQDGDPAGAIAKLKETTSFPAVCGRVCPQEEQCEQLCILGNKQKPLAIGRLERYAADWEFAQGVSSQPQLAPKNGKHVGVVGSGPAGLTCAGELAKLGYDVTLYEALHQPGGVLIYGIPEFRLPKAIVARECEYVESLGVQIKTDYVIGRSLTVDQMLADGHDAIFLANGAGMPSFMSIPGENLSGVYSADEFVTRSNLMKGYRSAEYDAPIKIGKTVAVIGGGDVALDAARTALRLGAQVHLIYRGSLEEMPARGEEIEHAQEEGIVFDLLANPTRIIGDDDGWVREIEVIDMELGEPDASGRRRPVAIEGSERRIPADVVIISAGTNANPLLTSTTGLDLTRSGSIIADEHTTATSKEGVFAGGEIVTGPTTVILAMGAGKTGARSIDRYLQGQSLPAAEQGLPEPQAPVPDNLGHVAVDKNACLTCAICAQVCASDAIELRPNEDACEWIYDPALCTFCGDCVTDCPVDALTQAADRAESSERLGEQIQIVTVDFPACRECGKPSLPYSEILLSKAFPRAAAEQRDRARLCEKCRERATALVMKEAMGGLNDNERHSHAR